MKLQEIYNIISKNLNRIDAKTLIKYTFNLDDLSFENSLEKDFDSKKIFDYEKRIIEGYPLQYITHKSYFYKSTFYVNDNVLIPQPDTEMLVEKALEIIDKNYKKYDQIKILDLCTGSRMYWNKYKKRA